jgi:hypothetical protein
MRIVTLSVAQYHATPALEILLPSARDLYRYGMPRAMGRKWSRIFDHILLMASGKSAYLSEKVKNEVLGGTAYSAPSTVYTALWTTSAGTDMDGYHGGTAGEVSGGSYDRVSKTNNTTNFASVTGDNAKVNSNAHTFPTATANWNSGNAIPQMGIFDGNAKTSADNLLIWGDLTVAKAVLNGDTAQFNASAISWSEE